MSALHESEIMSEAKSTIKRPNITSSSNRLLSPHHSVLEMLHYRQDEQIDQRTSSPPISLSFSTSSWQSIGDYLNPHPTSSVLSNSDIEDDNSDNAPVSVSPMDSSQHIELKLDGDDKTIEINLNSGLRAGESTASSNFVLPDISTYKDFKNTDALFEDLRQDKILIIGHKKTNFFRLLDDDLRSKFTLDIRANYKLILVIFDGLIKISNILNFVKRIKASTYNNGKLFISVFRNINLKILNKILAIHGIRLLCSPIKYENTKQVEFLLNLLGKKFFLEESNFKEIKYETYGNVYDCQLVRLNLDGSTSSNDKICQTKPIFKKSVIIRHHILEPSDGFMKSNLKSSKKLRSKQAKRKKFFLLTVSLSLGVGIGVTSAYFISLWKSAAKSMEPVSVSMSSYGFKELTKAQDFTLFGIKSTSEVLKHNMESLKDAIQRISTFVFHGINDKFIDWVYRWDSWFINAL